MSLKATLDRKLYPELGNNWDDQLFRERLLEIVEPSMTCLDFGAGRGNVEQLDLRGHVARVAGVDPDPVVLENPFVQEAKVLDLVTQRIDFPDATFDLAYADNVFEHIPDPEITFAELFRVLKPGGVLMAKTPNVWHYMPTIARLTPSRFPPYYNSLRGREEHVTLPTLYRANSRRRVRELGAGEGLRVGANDIVEGRPEYLRITAPT